MIYKDKDGQEVWLQKDLTAALQNQTKILKKYYTLAVIAAYVVIGALFWLLWQLKRYRIVTIAIDALRSCGG